MKTFFLCEGRTEMLFVDIVLKPHLASISARHLQIQPINLGGHKTYYKFVKEVGRFLNDPTIGIVTMMYDIFKVPGDFPGRNEAYPDPIRRVEAMEARLELDIGNKRFIPYLQLHEFEALLLADPAALALDLPERRDGVKKLASVMKQFRSPELVNDLQPPSRRIRQAIQDYAKASDGPAVAKKIGIRHIAEACPHFGQWVAALEARLV